MIEERRAIEIAKDIWNFQLSRRDKLRTFDIFINWVTEENYEQSFKCVNPSQVIEVIMNLVPENEKYVLFVNISNTTTLSFI